MKQILYLYYWAIRRRIEKYYGQFNPPTDYLIAKYFKQKKGFCIEVGAADGVSCSNSLHFEKLGWHALCIEANPIHEQSLQRNRKNYVMCAIGEHATKNADLHVAKMKNGVYEAVTSLALDDRLVKAHDRLISSIERVNVEVKTLDQCITEFYNKIDSQPSIDFITIDTEGTELSVLKGIDLYKWKVPLLVVENNYDDPEIGRYLDKFGYTQVLRYKVNNFYILNGTHARL